MANANIKISQLPDIGSNLNSNTLIPVVSTNGTYLTDKISLGNLANYILLEAGNLLPASFVSQLAYSVVNAAQPNITSVGTLNISNLHISGGSNGYVLQTDGNNNISWTAQSGSGNGNPGGSNTQIQFNNNGLFAGDINLTYNTDSGNLTAPYFIGDGTYLTNVAANVTYGNDDVANYLPNYTGNIGQLSFVGADTTVSIAGPNGAYLKLDGPDGVRLGSDQGNIDLWSNSNLNIITNQGISNKNFVFDSTGNLTLPDGSVISNGFIVGNTTAGISDITGNMQVYAETAGVGIQIFDGSEYRTWTFDTNGNLNTPGDIILGDPLGASILVSGVENEFVDLTAGPNGYAELQSNDRNNYVWTDNDAVYIATHYLVSPTQWTFNRDGNFNVPGNIDFNGDGEFSIGSNISNMSIYGINHVTVYSEDKGWDFDDTGNLTFPDLSVQQTAWTGTVDTSNITGLGNISTINLDGNVSNVLLGDGTFGTGAGLSGYSGFSGYSGIDGASGYSGIDGASGYSGIDGASGYSGYSGFSGQNGISSSYFNYTINTNINSGDPGNGNLIYNQTSQITSTQINVSHLTNDDVDIDIFLALIVATEIITIQDANDSNNYQTWTITGAPTNVSGYWTIPVTINTSAGTGASNFADGHSVILAVVNGVSGFSGASGASGVSGYSGISGFSGYSGISGFSGISGWSGASGFSGTAGPNNSINATDDTSTNPLYPVMVGAAGSSQTPKVTTTKLNFNASAGNLNITGNVLTTLDVVATGNVWANSGILRTTSTSANVFNSNATTVNIAGAASVVTNIGNSSGTINLSGNVQGNTNGFAIGYRDIPQLSFSGNTTLALTDAGKHYYSTLSTANTLTIPNNNSIAFATGTAINIINQGTGNITVAQGSGVTLYLAGNTTSGNRTLASYGVATLQKVATDTWFIVGVGVT